MKTPSSWFQAVGGVCVVLAGLLLATAAVPGCGGKTGQKTDTAAKTEGAVKTPENRNERRRPDNGENIAAGREHRGFWTNNGRKYYNKHPYDIWYGNAYQVAADSRPVGSAGKGNGKTVASIPKQKPVQPGVEKKAPVKPAGGWNAVVTGAALDAEMKLIANFCKEKLLTAARYSTSFKEIKNNAAALSAVAQVAANHPDAISWKADALYLRDLGLKLSETATERGTAKFRAAKEIFEKIDDILKKNKPAGLAEPKKDATFFDVASRGGLMRRMEAAHKWMNGEIKTEEQFKAKSATIAHEAAILGLMAKVIADKSYDSAEDAAYVKYVTITFDETQKIVAATKTGNFAAFQPALSKIYNQCNECHNGFRQ